MQDSRGNKKKVGIQDPGPLRWDRSLHQSSHHVRIKLFKVNVKSGPVPCPLSLCPGACWPVSMPCTRSPGSGSGCMCAGAAGTHAHCFSPSTLPYSTLPYSTDLFSRHGWMKRGKKRKDADERRAGRQAGRQARARAQFGWVVAWLISRRHICISA
jgi:hypothetical protein